MIRCLLKEHLLSRNFSLSISIFHEYSKPLLHNKISIQTNFFNILIRILLLFHHIQGNYGLFNENFHFPFNCHRNFKYATLQSWLCFEEERFFCLSIFLPPSLNFSVWIFGPNFKAIDSNRRNATSLSLRHWLLSCQWRLGNVSQSKN